MAAARLYDVILEGPVTDWVGRPGVNDGKPWRAKARCTVTCEAHNPREAKEVALNAERGAGYTRVVSAKARTK